MATDAKKEKLLEEKVPSENPDESIKVMSWNVQFFGQKRAKNIKQMAKIITSENPDVVVLQECMTLYETSEKIQKLKTELNMEYVQASEGTGKCDSSRSNGREFPIAFYNSDKLTWAGDEIVEGIPSGYIGETTYPGSYFPYTPYIFHFKAGGNGRSFFVGSVHLNPTETFWRSVELKLLFKCLKSHKEKYTSIRSLNISRKLFFIGDMNFGASSPYEYEKKWLKGFTSKDNSTDIRFANSSFKPTNEKGVLILTETNAKTESYDHAVYHKNQETSISNFNVVKKTLETEAWDWGKISNHLPIVLDLVV